MTDKDKAVASLWKEVWDDGGSAIDLDSNEDGGNKLEEKLLRSLVHEAVRALGDLAWSRRVAGAEALEDLAHRAILAPPPRQLDGKIPTSSLRRGRLRSEASSLALTTLVELARRSRLWSGKKDIVRAAVKISTRWMPFAGDSKAAESLFVNDTIIRPIAYGDFFHSKDDLFVGDSWFENESEELEQDVEADESIVVDGEQGCNEVENLNNIVKAPGKG